MDKESLHFDVKYLIERNIGEKVEIKIENPRFIKAGFSNDIAMFSLSYYSKQQEFSEEVVLKDYSKSYKGTDGATKYKKELTIFKNFKNDNYIKVPKVYFSDEERKLILMEKIEGETLDKVERTSERNHNEALRMFGESLAYIHLQDYKSIDKDLGTSKISSELYLYNYIETLKSRILCLGEEEYLPILESIRNRFKYMKFSNTCLNHGDYHFWNTIFTNRDKLYILDWEKAKIADYRYDIANTLILCYSWFGFEFKKAMLGGYESVTGTSVKDLSCFEALKAFDSFTSCIPLILGGDDSHIRDRTFIWVKRRYELFVEHNGTRNEKAEDYLKAKGCSY
jgi:aminoglycoside phosphotransferase (APT) family kinase protein